MVLFWFPQGPTDDGGTEISMVSLTFERPVSPDVCNPSNAETDAQFRLNSSVDACHGAWSRTMPGSFHTTALKRLCCHEQKTDLAHRSGLLIILSVLRKNAFILHGPGETLTGMTIYLAYK